jgi:hypothetical protein
MTRAGHRLIRYADDFVILCRTAEQADQAKEQARQTLADMGLQLHPEKTRIVDATSERFQFLGYEFWPTGRAPRPSSKQKLRDRIRAKTPRCSGKSLRAIIASLTPMLRLVRLLPPQLVDRLSRHRRLCAQEVAQHPAQVQQTARVRSDAGQPPAPQPRLRSLGTREGVSNCVFPAGVEDGCGRSASERHCRRRRDEGLASEAELRLRHPRLGEQASLSRLRRRSGGEVLSRP